MKLVVASVALLWALALAPTPLIAAPIPNVGTTIMCVKPDGASTDRNQDSLHGYVGCPRGAIAVMVDICGDNESSVANSPEANRVRAAAMAQGTLRSVRYQGRRFCQREYLNGSMGDNADLPQPPA